MSIADKPTTAAEATPSVEKEIPTGPAAAAILAAGIGSTALDIFVILNDAFAGLSKALTFSTPVGPLSGKTTYAVVIWLVSWILLYLRLRTRQVNFMAFFGAGLALIVLGFLLCYPPVFEPIVDLLKAMGAK